MIKHDDGMFLAKHIPWALSEERREAYADSSRRSQRARQAADMRAAEAPAPPLTVVYDPNADMVRLPSNGVRALSLFSGGGGLDLGFDRAGFEHVASYDVLKFAGETLRENRPDWRVFSGDQGNVIGKDWRSLRGRVDLVHGGPPCQPFSIAGRRQGQADMRDMFPEFLRAVEEIKPDVFVAENVLGFLSASFAAYRKTLLGSVSRDYELSIFVLSAKEFGVPQDRRRAIIVGCRTGSGKSFRPEAIDRSGSERGVRAALGLSSSGVDGFAPTLRCTLTGPRQTTSIANSTASVSRWTELGIWPHGVSPDRAVSASFPTRNQTYRLCVEECQILQGFPLDWTFVGAVYQRLGLVGNSVCPPVAYALAKSLSVQLFSD